MYVCVCLCVAAANNLRFPDPRDFRLAIVDEPAGVRLRVGFLSPSLDGKDVEVRLLVAIGVDAWPHTTNYPGRVPLGHAECLLFHRTAEMVSTFSLFSNVNLLQASLFRFQ